MFFDAKKYHTAKFSSFKSGEDRLDSFLSEILQMQVEYQDLWLTVQLLLTLSHGQATVERGFSVNKEVLTPNLQEVSLCKLVKFGFARSYSFISKYAIING